MSASSSEQFKLSCDQAVQLAGQFITLATGGIAFVVGLVYSSEQHLHPGVVIPACLLFGLSVILGLMMRMGVVSDLHKNATCNIYAVRLRTVAALQILLFLLGAAVLALATFQRALSPVAKVKAPPSSPWIASGSGMTAGISGLALVEHDAARTVLLAVHDNKAPNEPRLSLLTRREGVRGVLRQPVEWPGTQPVDLEAICRVPGEADFLAVTSKGGLYRIALDRDRTHVAVRSEARLPGTNEKSEIEGFDTRSIGGKIIACWAQRGDRDKPAVVASAVFDPEKLSCTLVSEAKFATPWPVQAARHISDLRLTETGAVLVTSTSDPGDYGPFASALYIAGRLDVASPMLAFVPEASPTRLWITPKHKVEALEQISGPTGGLLFGADDEAKGGALFFAFP